MQLFKFFQTENTSKQQNMVTFVRNCLVKTTLRLFQSISVAMNMVPMLLRQFRRLAQGHCWSYANSLKQLIYSYTYEKTFSSLSPAYWRYKPGLFFSWQIKMSNLLHVGLILIISKVFNILCLLCLCRNREYRGNFENKTVISKLFFQISAQVK